jgi:phage terminase large subunit
VSSTKPIPILLFADSSCNVKLYDWQANVLLNYEAGNPTAAACANFTGKTSTLFPIAALWTLYNFPRARVMYLSATGAQVKNQFFASLNRFRNRPAFSGWNWLETEVRTPQGGFLFGRATDTGGHIEGIHNQVDSPAALLVDEAKSIANDVLSALERCHTRYRLFASSTGGASGGFYEIMTAKAHRWRTFTIPSSLCPHVSPDLIEEDRLNLKDNVFRIKHGAEWLYDAGDSMISLEHVRDLIRNPPNFAPGPKTAFCDFAGPGDESALAVCEGNRCSVIEAWRSRDTMNSVGKFLNHFRRLGLEGHQVGGDEGYGHQLMDRMSEQGFRLQRFNNGAKAKRSDIFANQAAEAWSTTGQLIERKQIILPNDEKLVAQLTSRRKFYDSAGREKLEPKDELRSRGCESPDRADAIIGALAMRLFRDRYAFNPVGREQLNESYERVLDLMTRDNQAQIAGQIQRWGGEGGSVDWSRLW